MGGRLKRSRKQSDGNPEQSPHDDFVLYLDENLHNCAPIREVLDYAGVKYQRHDSHFKTGEIDAVWLPRVAEEGWIILTKDKGIRYNELEIHEVIAHKARQFYFRQGNWSGVQMAEILSKALPKMRRLFQKVEAPFIASLTQSGEVHLRYDKDGSVYRQKRKRGL
jgi:PIN like domain